MTNATAKETANATAWTWSDEQESIFDWFRLDMMDMPNSAPSLLVRARAGTGKTTTILEGVKRAPAGLRILICAFNKRIQVELQDKLRKSVSNPLDSPFTPPTRPDISALTLHSLGFRAVRKFWNNVRVDSTGDRAFSLARAVCTGDDVPDTIISLVAKLHTKGREIAPLAKSPDDLLDLAYRFDCVPDEYWSEWGWTAERVCQLAYYAMKLAKKRPRDGMIDFTDMVYLPVANGWLRPEYDIVVVDEAQDMNQCQLLIAQRVSKGRLCVVGDDRQAIYGFRGADSGALDRLKQQYKAVELPLCRTYRCAKSVVREAQRFVSDYVADESNQEGEVKRLADGPELLIDLVTPGDAVLSRLNAPLVSLCLKLLRRGVPARVEGKDVVKSLRVLIRKLAKGRAANSVPEFLRKLHNWSEKEQARIEASGSRIASELIENVQDKAEMLREFAQDAVSVGAIRSDIERVFSQHESGPAVVLSSVHKSKGLEWPTVYVLEDTLRAGEGNQEEDNIAYVAITRAINTLVYS